MRIVFMGTPDFAAASLKKLIDEKRDVVGVFTQPDKPKGRGMELAASPVKVLALENGIGAVAWGSSVSAGEDARRDGA